MATLPLFELYLTQIGNVCVLRNPQQMLPLRILGHPPRTKTQHARSPCRGTQYMTRGAVPLVTLKRGMPSLPFLSLRLAPNVGVNGPNSPPPTRVDERGGPWDSFTMDADSLPLLQSSLPLTIIYRKVNGAWLQHLLIAESSCSLAPRWGKTWLWCLRAPPFPWS